jgi:MFS transporter, DHA1 family, inner membrane transport protein
MTPSKSPLLLALALWFAGLGAAGQFAKIGVIYDYVSAHYAGTSGPVHGLLVSGVGFAGLIFGSTAGILLARAGTKRVMIAALIAGAVISLIESLLPALPVFLGLRLIEGFAHLAIVVAGPVIIAETIPEKERAFAMTLWSTFFAVCFAFMAWSGRPLVAAYGIPSLMIAHAIYMVLMAMVLAFLLPKDVSYGHAPLSAGALLQQHIEIYASPWISAPALGFMFYTLMYVAVLTLLPPMTGQYQTFIATAVPLVSIASSLTLGVYLISRFPAVAIVQTGFVIAALAAFIMWACWSIAPLMIFGTLLLSAAVGLVQSASFAAIAQLNETHENRSRAAGAIAQLGNVGTTSGTPILAALIAAYDINGLAAFTFLLSLGGVAVHAWLRARRESAVAPVSS